MTLPPLHVAGRVQFSVEANRGHVVVLHPAKQKQKKKKKKADFTQDGGGGAREDEPRPL
jgi:hypothetical protein